MSGRISFLLALAWLAVAGAFTGTSDAQTLGLGIRPMRLEIEVPPGQAKTSSFMIESPPSDTDVRGRLILALSDWAIHEDTTVTYHEAGTEPRSASSWITFSPSDLAISSGQSRMVRVTASVPAGTTPGVYTSALFVQERPPAKPPDKGEHLLFFRFRYAVTLYVVVPPVTRQAEIADVQLEHDSRGIRLRGQLKNIGTRHLRPFISWFVRCGTTEVVTERNVEATVLLPESTTNETLALPTPLAPGEYEIEMQVDFRDGRPIQAVRRMVTIAAPSPTP